MTRHELTISKSRWDNAREAMKDNPLDRARNCAVSAEVSDFFGFPVTVGVGGNVYNNESSEVVAHLDHDGTDIVDAFDSGETVEKFPISFGLIVDNDKS